jgi:hypothetical protein
MIVKAVKAVRRTRPAKQQREKDQRSWIDITLEHVVERDTYPIDRQVLSLR